MFQKKLYGYCMISASESLKMRCRVPDYFFKWDAIYVMTNNMDKAKHDITAACQKGYSKACNYQF